MRDPERINRILNKIRTAWSVRPDMRLGQLLINLTGIDQTDLFQLEDDELEANLDKLNEAGKWFLQ